MFSLFNKEIPEVSEQVDVQDSVENSFEDEGTLELDVFETDENFTILAPLGGVKMEDLDIFATDNAIIIKGFRQRDSISGLRSALVSECSWGDFSRSIILPDKAKLDMVSAKLKNGVLKVVVPTTSAKTKIQITD